MNEGPYPPAERERWSYYNVRFGVRKESALQLWWEVAGDPYSDDYSSDEIAAPELFTKWMNYVERENLFYDPPGVGWLRIAWLVLAADRDLSEFAPFDVLKPDRENFLTYFSWPVSVTTGERLNWLRVPVVDKHWNAARGDKGGFIQEATGWKPSALQPFTHIDHLRSVPLD